jgi:hypothetical protein
VVVVVPATPPVAVVVPTAVVAASSASASVPASVPPSPVSVAVVPQEEPIARSMPIAGTTLGWPMGQVPLVLHLLAQAMDLDDASVLMGMLISHVWNDVGFNHEYEDTDTTIEALRLYATNSHLVCTEQRIGTLRNIMGAVHELRPLLDVRFVSAQTDIGLNTLTAQNDTADLTIFLSSHAVAMHESKRAPSCGGGHLRTTTPSDMCYLCHEPFDVQTCSECQTCPSGTARHAIMCVGCMQRYPCLRFATTTDKDTTH